MRKQSCDLPEEEEATWRWKVWAVENGLDMRAADIDDDEVQEQRRQHCLNVRRRDAVYLHAN